MREPVALVPTVPVRTKGGLCVEDGCNRTIYYGHNKYWCREHYIERRYEALLAQKKPDPPPILPVAVDTLKKYSLTGERYMEMLDSQGGVCAICKQPSLKRRLAVDHDHSCCGKFGSCGKCVRGLLCGKCNTALWIVEHHLESAVAYLKKYAEK